MQEGLHTQTSTHATSWWWSKGSSKDLFCIFMFLSTLEELEQGLQPKDRSAHPSILIIRSLSSGGRQAREWRRRRLRRMARLELDWFACTPLPRRLLHPAISCTWLLLDFLKKSKYFLLSYWHCLHEWLVWARSIKLPASHSSPAAAVAAAVL